MATTPPTRTASPSSAARSSASRRAASLAQQRYNNGLTDFLNVLDAQRQLYALEDQYAVALDDLIRQYVALYKALGGGWEGYERRRRRAPGRPSSRRGRNCSSRPSEGGRGAVRPLPSALSCRGCSQDAVFCLTTDGKSRGSFSEAGYPSPTPTPTLPGVGEFRAIVVSTRLQLPRRGSPVSGRGWSSAARRSPAKGPLLRVWPLPTLLGTTSTGWSLDEPPGVAAVPRVGSGENGPLLRVWPLPTVLGVGRRAG